MERGGCEFGIFFDGRTPQDLIDDGIYYNIAVALHSGQFWPVSAALAAKGLDATTVPPALLATASRLCLGNAHRRNFGRVGQRPHDQEVARGGDGAAALERTHLSG
jgi:hypothetical protein